MRVQSDKKMNAVKPGFFYLILKKFMHADRIKQAISLKMAF